MFRRVIACSGILWISTVGGGHADSMEVQSKDTIRQEMTHRLVDLSDKYNELDSSRQHGRGLSDDADSAVLAWGESYILRDYVRLYHATRDTFWLDKVCAHFDRMLAHLTRAKDGYQSWTTISYDVCPVEVFPEGDTGGMHLNPPIQRPSANGNGPGRLVTGHTYRIGLDPRGVVGIVDLTDGNKIASLAYQDGMKINAIPGAIFTLTGQIHPGAAFKICTTHADPLAFVAHDGMVCYPIAQWIEIVHKDPKLYERYGVKAKKYLRFIDHDVWEKWERYWQELPGVGGTYNSTASPNESSPNTRLPHNMYLALGRIWLVLQSIRGIPHQAEYRDRATKMAHFFRSHLQAMGRAYVWQYWDPQPESRVTPHIEDCAHATIDVGFATEAWQRGVVFTRDDLRRMSSTFVDLMWNQSLDKPIIAGNVDGTGGAAADLDGWLYLATVDPRVWQAGWAWFGRSSEPARYFPLVLDVYDRLIGISSQERQLITSRFSGTSVSR